MELRHLRYFVAVAEERHFTKGSGTARNQAAAVEPADTSARTGDGDASARRLTRGVQLTEAGALLLEEARAILEQVERT